MKRITIINRREKGQSFVELAFSFIILLLLISGAVDIGRALFAFIAIRDAAQEGATYLSLFPKDINGMNYRIRNSSTTPINLTDTTAVLIPTPDKSCADGYVTVRVQYNFRSVMPFMNLFFGDGIFRMEAKVTDTILTHDCS